MWVYYTSQAAVESDGTLVTGAGPDRRKEERSVRERNEQQLDDKEASCISAGGHRIEGCLDSKFASQIHYAEFLFPVTSKYWHIYGVLNIDEIKN
jgi:hypothetical protein